MNKSVLTLAVLVAMLSLFIAGCGGGDSTLGTSNTNPVAPNLSGDGTLEFSVDWKAISEDYATKGLDGKLIYNSINSIKVQAINTTTSNVAATTVIARPSGTTTTTAALTVPAGTYYVDCGGYTGTDGSGTLISHRRKYVNVVAGSTNAITATLGVSIIGGALTPATTYAEPGDTIYWSNNDTTASYKVLCSGAGMEITVPAFDPNGTAGQNEKGFTFTTASTSAGYTYNIYKTTDLSTIVATGYVKVLLQSGSTYAYSSSLSKVNTQNTVLTGTGATTSNIGLGIDSSSNIYYFNSSSNVIDKYNSAGTYAQTYNLVGTAAAGNSVFAFDNSSNYMYLLNSSGTLTKYDVSTGTALGTVNPGITGITNIACTTGYIYVSNASNVTCYNTTTGANSGVAAVSGTTGLAVDANRYVYIANGTNTLTVYDSSNNSYTAYLSGSSATPPTSINKVFVNSSNNIFAVDYPHSTVYYASRTLTTSAPYTATYTWTAALTNSGFDKGKVSYPLSIVADSSNNYYVADRFEGRVQKGSGTTVGSQWFTFGGLSTVAPGIAQDASGYVYIADSGSNRIAKFDPNLSYAGSLGYNSTTGGSYFSGTGINGIVTDSAYNVYVADNSGSVYKFDSAGTVPSSVWPISITAPKGLAIDSNYIYIAGNTNNIYRYDSAGAAQTASGAWPVSFGTSIEGIAVDSSGNVYASDSGSKIWKVNSSAGKSTLISSLSSAPKGIAVDTKGYLYIVCTDGNIYKYSSTGSLVSYSTVAQGWTLPAVGTSTCSWGILVSTFKSGYLYAPGSFVESSATGGTKYIGVYAPNAN